jgi:hypothetical protein
MATYKLDRLESEFLIGSDPQLWAYKARCVEVGGVAIREVTFGSEDAEPLSAIALCEGINTELDPDVLDYACE